MNSNETNDIVTKRLVEVDNIIVAGNESYTGEEIRDKLKEAGYQIVFVEPGTKIYFAGALISIGGMIQLLEKS